MRRMKDSGVPWIGEIPEEWAITKIKHNYHVILGKMLSPKQTNPSETLENYLCAQNITEEGINIADVRKMWISPYESKHYLLNIGDIIVVEGGNVGLSCIYGGEVAPCYIQNALHRVFPKNNFSNKFLLYWMKFVEKSNYIQQITNRATISHYTKEKLENTPFVNISLDEQHRIADYLDAKCAEIDHSMELVRQGIDKLKEYKKSVITEAVTKGLDPDVPMKDSGVPWIGEMPEGWDIQKIKFFSLIKNGDAIRSEELLDDGLFEAFGGNGKIGNCNKYNCDGNIFIIGRVGALCGNIRKSNKKIFISDNALILKIIQNDFDFIYFSLVAANLGSLSTSNAQPLITATKINNVYIALSPLSEQHRIASYLDAKCAEIDAIIARKQELLDKLAAYKKSLIYECVTGKREVAA